MPSIREKIRGFVKGDPATKQKRARRNAAYVYKNLPVIQTVLLAAGFLWMLLIPSPLLSQGTYVDENALQPGQVNTYWNWGDVGHADAYLGDLEILRDKNASSGERAEYLSAEFAKLGLSTEIQNYSFSASTQMLQGANTYAVLSSPRASGTEAIIISASWISLQGGNNLRGIATVLSLASFLRGYSHWSKSLIFVISDGHLEGMQAWLSSYHGRSQKNLVADSLTLPSGVVWTALNIDYPGHSFSHLGIFREGVNGRLPNQDLINSFRVISYTVGVPVVLYDHIEPSEYPGRQQLLDVIPSWLPKSLTESPSILEYVYRAKSILRHFGYQARGKASGVHGLLHQYRIDAITLYAVPSNGPHGFYALGRIVESTLRTMSNLLERLHASFFFYILATPGQFLKIGMYLPCAILIGTGLMFGGLGAWVEAGWVEIEETDEKTGVTSRKRWVSRTRDLIPVLKVVFATHTLGALVFWIILRSVVMQSPTMYLPIVFLAVAATPFAIVSDPLKTLAGGARPKLLKATTLCLASTLISVTSVLNFSLATLLAIMFGIPLTLAGPTNSTAVRFAKSLLYIALSAGWMTLLDNMRDALWQWEVLGVWFAPLVCIIYMPLMLQAAIASVYASDVL